MSATTKAHPDAGLPVATAQRSDDGARKAALGVAGFLTGFLVVNTYWGFGGRGGLVWVLGADCTVPLPVVWAQEAAVFAGTGVVLGRAAIWRSAVPSWIFRLGIWAMTASFAAVGLQNLLGDTTAQARLLFAPTAFALSALCAVVARRAPSLIVPSLAPSRRPRRRTR